MELLLNILLAGGHALLAAAYVMYVLGVFSG